MQTQSSHQAYRSHGNRFATQSTAMSQVRQLTVTADGSLLSPTGGVKGIYLAPEIHEQFMIHKWLRNTAYIFTHNFNNLERTVTSCINTTMHTDVNTA